MKFIIKSLTFMCLTVCQLALASNLVMHNKSENRIKIKYTFRHSDSQKTVSKNWDDSKDGHIFEQQVKPGETTALLGQEEHDITATLNGMYPCYIKIISIEVLTTALFKSNGKYLDMYALCPDLRKTEKTLNLNSEYSFCWTSSANVSFAVITFNGEDISYASNADVNKYTMPLKYENLYWRGGYNNYS